MQTCKVSYFVTETNDKRVRKTQNVQITKTGLGKDAQSEVKDVLNATHKSKRHNGHVPNVELEAIRVGSEVWEARKAEPKTEDKTEDKKAKIK